MKLQKGDLGVLIFMILLIVSILLIAIHVFNKNAERCDEEKGYQCNASQVFTYNKKVD